MRIARHLTLAELEERETLSVGQADDLKIEDQMFGVRVWLSRCGPEDGEPYRNKVTVEHRAADGKWYTFETYQAR